VPAFESNEDVARWLANKPRDVAVVLAARAALRIVPVLSIEFELHNLRLDEAQRKTVLRTFRCVSAAWATASFRGRSAELQTAAAAAGSGVQNEEAYKTETAASWAAAAAGAAPPDAPRFASHAISYAVAAAGDMGRQPFYDFLNSCAADADILDQGYDSVTLALSSQLWPTVPDWAFDAWAQLEHALIEPREGWEVWTDWYEARLKAGHADPVLEVARVTVPIETWNEGAKPVNGQIKQWLVERGVWRYATTDEPQSLEDESEYRSNESRLAALSGSEATVIGARIAMRALPLVTLSARRFADPALGAAVLALFGAAARAWFATLHPNNSAGVGRAPGPITGFPMGAYDSDLGIVVAGQAVSASTNPYDQSGAGILTAVRAISNAAARSDGRHSAAAFQLALNDDLQDLEGASPAELARLPLWPGGLPPDWMAQRWDHLKRELIEIGVGWEVWATWYDHRLAGNVYSENIELPYVAVPDELWIDGPARVNTWILKQIEEQNSQSSSAQPADATNDGSVAEDPELPDINAIPEQTKNATQFILSAEGLIDLVPDPPGHAARIDPIQRAHYDELRHKAAELLNLGHNQLGDLTSPLDRFLGALPQHIENVSIVRLWSRGNTLRQRLKANDRASSDPTDPARLMPRVAEGLRDLVETYNVFIIGDPRGREFDQARLGPQDRQAALRVLDAAKPIVGAVLASKGVVTRAALEALREQTESASTAPLGIDGDQAISLARNTSENLISEMLRVIYRPIRRAVYQSASNLSGALDASNQQIVAFVAEHAAKLDVFADQAFHNPAVTHIIRIIIKLVSSGS
jgi:hypothetical protein